MNEPDWTTHITSGASWRRFGLMIVFLPILACVGFFIAFTALFQFFNVLSQGEPNPNLGRGGRDLARYASDIIDFLTYNSEKRPFPFVTDETAVTESAATPASPKPAAAPRKKKPAARKKTGTTRKKTTTRHTATRKKPVTKKSATKKTSETHTPEPPLPEVSGTNKAPE